VEERVRDIFLILFPFITAGLGAWLAAHRGRSAVGWFCLSLLFGVIGLGILAALPRLRFTCPRCTHPYTRGATVCASCSATLPRDVIAERLTPGIPYDSQCPECETPYREGDYRPDADVIFCSFCKAQLGRRTVVTQS
jgi:hypothetical protein